MPNLVGFCADCLYYDEAETTGTRTNPPPAGLGLCRRHAPSVLAADVADKAVAWPVTDPADWCGEYQLRMGSYARETGSVRGAGLARIPPGGEGGTS